LIEDPETAKHVIQLFLNINGQMDESIRAIEKQTSAKELKEYKRAVGFVMYEIFERIIEPLCRRRQG
jgi:uncharacterized protein with von Willebrand factor type A (vWA) domain